MNALLSRPLAPDMQDAVEHEMVEAHCGHLPAAMAPGMVEAQRLRDAALAAAALRLLAATDDRPIAVIAGNGHVRRDRGVPAYLPDNLGVVTVVITEAEPGETPGFDPGATDFLWLVPPAERPDPCEAFRQ